MTVNFKFDYVLNLHNRSRYIQSIEKDGVSEDVAFKMSMVQINRCDIKSIEKSSDGSAIIILKSPSIQLKTVEEYDEVIDVMQHANLALDIMRQEKIYIFDDFEVDDDELNVCESWSDIKNNMQNRKK
jgi:hypothetical protein